MITGCIYQEVLQGTRSDIEFTRLREYFDGLPCCPSPGRDSYAAAALLYARLRWQGQTVRKANDCLIAQEAVENGLWLVHDDADFEALASIEPRLKLG